MSQQFTEEEKRANLRVRLPTSDKKAVGNREISDGLVNL